MEGQCKRTSRPDLISNLPDNVIENILERISLRDALRTSVLSKKWLNAWETLPQLVFDGRFLLGSGLSQKELNVLVLEILLTHRGPILRFKLTALGECHGIHHIIKFLSQNGIQDLTLGFNCNDEPYKLPSYLFSCVKLKYLHLENCILQPPATFNGFKNLVTLKLMGIVFDQSVSGTFFSKFPLLESLMLGNCRDVHHLSIHAPMLKYFKLESAFKSIKFRNTGQLKTAIIGTGSWKRNVDNESGGRAINIAELFDSLHGTIVCLIVGYYFWEVFATEHVPPILAKEFNRLKLIGILKLNFRVKVKVQCAMCLLRSSPYLHYLKIGVFADLNGDEEAVIQLFKDHDHSGISFDHLKQVDMVGYWGTNAEKEFVKLMLAKSPSLQTMRIKIHTSIAMEGQLRIVKQVTLFRRASATAVVECV